MKHLLITLVAAASLLSPAWSQTTEAVPSNQERPKNGGPDVEFVDSEEAYWVNRGFNDMLYYGANGSPNSVRLERNQYRADKALNKIYKPPQGVEIIKNGQVQPQTPPKLKIDGQEARTRPSGN